MELNDNRNSDDTEEYFRQSNSNNSEIDRKNEIKPFEVVKIPFKSKNSFKKADFEFSSTLGKGAYAKVIQAKHIKTEEVFAIKIVERKFFEKELL